MIVYYNNDNEYVDFDENTRKVTLMNGKTKKISKEEWSKYLITSKGDEVEGILIWLEDNEIAKNSEQERLVMETVGQRISIDKEVKREKDKVKKTRTKKVDEVKKSIIDAIVVALGDLGEVTVLNEDKMVSVMINGQEYKINLTKTRGKK